MTSDGSSVPVDALLFDFFGTLVSYEPDRSQLQYSASHRLVASWGCQLSSHDEFVAEWDSSSRHLEASLATTRREFDMTDAAQAFSDRLGLGLSPSRCQELGAVFVDEWQRHVQPVPGVSDLIERLSTRFRIALVSNTHDRTMIPRMLHRMGIADLIDPVLLSVDHGWQKPHPSIYAAALATLGMSPDRVVFVGDSYVADFVGPEASGITSYLIDADSNHRVPADRRLGTVLEIESSLNR